MLFTFLALSFSGIYLIGSDLINLFENEYEYNIRMITIIILFILLAELAMYQTIHNSKILNDLKYIIMFICANIITIIILIRAAFDPSFGKFGYLFIVYNSYFIMIMYICILLYSLINTHFKKKKTK